MVRFHKNTGRIDTTLEAEGYDVLKDWALKTTTKTKDVIIFKKRTGEIVFCISGTLQGGEIESFEQGLNVETLCPGLVAAVNAPD